MSSLQPSQILDSVREKQQNGTHARAAASSPGRGTLLLDFSASAIGDLVEADVDSSSNVDCRGIWRKVVGKHRPSIRPDEIRAALRHTPEVATESADKEETPQNDLSAEEGRAEKEEKAKRKEDDEAQTAKPEARKRAGEVYREAEQRQSGHRRDDWKGSE